MNRELEYSSTRVLEHPATSLRFASLLLCLRSSSYPATGMHAYGHMHGCIGVTGTAILFHVLIQWQCSPTDLTQRSNATLVRAHMPARSPGAPNAPIYFHYSTPRSSSDSACVVPVPWYLLLSLITESHRNHTGITRDPGSRGVSLCRGLFCMCDKNHVILYNVMKGMYRYEYSSTEYSVLYSSTIIF